MLVPRVEGNRRATTGREQKKKVLLTCSQLRLQMGSLNIALRPERMCNRLQCYNVL